MGNSRAVWQVCNQTPRLPRIPPERATCLPHRQQASKPIQHQRSATSQQFPEKPKVIGLYGLPGAGKTTLLQHLKVLLSGEDFAFYEGFELLDSLVPEGLEAFKKFSNEEKKIWREQAVEKIATDSVSSGKTAIVTGHFSFWSEEKGVAEPVYTQKDLDTYTHIIYVSAEPGVIVQICKDDQATRSRTMLTAEQIDDWQGYETEKLWELCCENGILYKSISNKWTVPEVAELVKDFRLHSEQHNDECAVRCLDGIVSGHHSVLETMLLIDGDKTLAAVDTGDIFWQQIKVNILTRIGTPTTLADMIAPPKDVFDVMHYSYTAFRQVALLYEGAAKMVDFEAHCEAVANKVSIHPEFIDLLRVAAAQDHVGAVIVTCGLKRVWEKVLENAGLGGTVQVIGGGRIQDGYVVTAEVKEAVVNRLQQQHGLRVVAFGDSSLDLPMLQKADEAIVVVCDETIRSKGMEQNLQNAIDNEGLKAHQLLLPSTRLHPTSYDSASAHIPATNHPSAKVLMSPTRDASTASVALRAAHHRIGYYLATELVAKIIGFEPYPIQHVQGGMIDGCHLLHEEKTSIVALMRGGEPIAFGVSEAFPLAMFVHTEEPGGLTIEHLKGQETVILVDSVINTGSSIVKFVGHIRTVNPAVRIVAVAGVVQAEAVRPGGAIRKLAQGEDFSLVALRLSDNKYTGQGGTDTGHRLFNTTHMD